jgi:hypothetical protein
MTPSGWLSLLGDPALTLMHENPGYRWGWKNSRLG